MGRLRIGRRRRYQAIAKKKQIPSVFKSKEEIMPVTPHSVTLTWIAPTTGDAVTNYDVQRADVVNGTVGAFATIGSPTGVSFVDTNVIAGKSYEYRVASVNAAGESTFIVSPIELIPLAVPQPPTALVAQVS